MNHRQQRVLFDPASPLFGGASTALAAALALIDASSLDERQRRAVHLVTALLSGLYGGITMGGKHLPRRVLTGCVMAAAALRFADAGDVVDARTEGMLRRAGMSHPRAWMAAGSAVMTFAGFLADRAAAGRALDGATRPSEGTHAGNDHRHESM